MEHDVVQITVDLLNDNWNAANVDKPTIGISEDIKRLDLNNKDGILVYETGPKLREKGNLFYSVEDLNSFVSIDIRLSTSAPSKIERGFTISSPKWIESGY